MNTTAQGDRKVKGWARKIRHKRARQEAMKVYHATMVLHGFQNDRMQQWAFGGPDEYKVAKRAAGVAYSLAYLRIFNESKGSKLG